MIFKFIKSFKKIKFKNNEELFDGNTYFFKKYKNDIKIYGEYGVGLSTIFIANNTSAEILSVDSSFEWANIISKKLKNKKSINISYIDIGLVGDWGRPLTYSLRINFINYINSIWNQRSKPNFILIDGRFRVACFLYTLLISDTGSIILFDDYTDRLHYHVVEEFLKPIEINGRQALFIVDNTINKEKIKKEFELFLYVMD